jgi:hypothetical protein
MGIEGSNNEPQGTNELASKGGRFREARGGSQTGFVSWHRPRGRDTKGTPPTPSSVDFHFRPSFEGRLSFDATSRVVP